jgi:hypothetical protein
MTDKTVERIERRLKHLAEWVTAHFADRDGDWTAATVARDFAALTRQAQVSDDAVVERLRGLLAEAHPVPWELQDGSSWRRIGTKHGPCGNVLCPTKDHHDGHPDLTASDGRLYDNLTLIVEGINALPSLLDAIATMQSTDTEAVRELAEALDDARLFIDLVRLRARREGDVEQEIEAQDSLRNAEAALAKLKERGQ